jgi:YVTN family beta-propeller protein
VGLAAISTPARAELAYIALSSGGLAIADTTTNTVLATLSLGTQGGYGVAVSPDGSRVYVANYPNLVYVVDTASRKVIAQPQVVVPTSVVASPDGKWVYVAGESSNVSVIDTSTNTVSRVVPTGQIASAHIGLTSDGQETYCQRRKRRLFVHCCHRYNDLCSDANSGTRVSVV